MTHRTAGRRGVVAGAVLACALFGLSCNAVREDRRGCPCTLAVEMRSLPLCPVWLYADGRPAGQALKDTCLAVQVPKGPLSLLTAVAGASSSDGLSVHIPLGEEAPPLYAWSAWADCSSDQGSATVCLRRHFCTLALEVVSPPGWAQPFRVEVRGAVDGWSLAAGKPLPGPFRCSLSAGFRCRLPRQRPGDELWLDVVMPEGVVRTFSLGEALRRAGYDWTAEDLPDIGLRLDLSVTEIRLVCEGFGAPIPVEIVI